MKLRPIYIIPLALALCICLGSCNKGKQHTADMTDAQKIEVLDLKIERNPNNDRLLYERAQVLMNLGRSKEALYDINHAIDLNPEEVTYRLLKADASLANGYIEDSYRALTEAEQMQPDNREVQLKLGEITFYAGDYDRSMQCLSRVTEQDPNNRTALTIKSFIYKETKDTASAVTLLRRVCDLYPDHATAFEQLGVLYAMHDDPLAIEYLSTALRLEPNNTNAMYTLAQYMQEHGQIDQAEQLYHQILDINPNSTDAWHNLGYIECFEYSDYPRAIDYYTHALEADPRSLNALVDRGCAYELSNKPDSARADFTAALSIDATYQPALDGLKRIK